MNYMYLYIVIVRVFPDSHFGNFSLTHILAIFTFWQMFDLFANNGDPVQMPCSAASDLGLHCLPIKLLGVSRLQWVKQTLTLKFNK